MFSSAGCRLNHFGGRTSFRFTTRLGRLSPNWNNSAITRRSEPLVHCETARTTLYAAKPDPLQLELAHRLDLHGVLNRYRYARTDRICPRLRLGDRDCGHQRHFERAAVASAWLLFRRFAVAERYAVPRKPGNSGGGKGPQFKTNARRGEGPGDWANLSALWSRVPRRLLLARSAVLVGGPLVCV
jgi:hypothetical protein